MIRSTAMAQSENQAATATLEIVSLEKIAGLANKSAIQITALMSTILNDDRRWSSGNCT